MPDDEQLRQVMIKNLLEEIEELEKGIVLCTQQMSKMQGINADLRVLAGIRQRRESLEEEYLTAKKKLEILRSGTIPEDPNADKRIKIAKHNAHEAAKIAQKGIEKREDKYRDVIEDVEVFDPDDKKSKE